MAKKSPSFYRKILPWIASLITGHPRQLIPIEWSSSSWTHNIFRVWEMIFWRRAGIKAELSSAIDNEGNVTYYYHSYEAMCALFEQKIREALKFQLRLPYKIVFPQLAPIGGMPVQTRMSPYLFAIAYDANSSATVVSNTSGQTWAHTCTGSNRLLFTGTFARTSEHTLSSVAYAGSGATLIDSQQGYLNTDTIYAYYKVAPATGSNNIVTTYSASGYGGSVATSYTGMKQTGQPEATVKDAGDGSSNNFSLTVTTTAANAWIIGVWQPADGSCSAGANSAMRITDNDQIGDAGPFATPGSNALNMTGCGNRVQSKIASSFAPNTSVDYTISAAQGTYTLTGIAALFHIALQMLAALGTYTLTGIDAALSIGKGIAADVGSFVVTGVDSTFRVTLSIIAAAGSYTLTGVAATFQYGISIIASMGSFIVTFATVRVPLILKGESKNYVSMTGQSKHYTTLTGEPKSNVD